MKAIEEFTQIFSSLSMSPVDKLYKMQYLSISEFFEKNRGKDENPLVLMSDENIHILTYIMIQARIPDLASQIELITAFATNYMQEGQDGPQISQTYLNIIACFRYLQSMEHGDGPRLSETIQNQGSVNQSMYHNDSALGLSQFLNQATYQRTQSGYFHNRSHNAINETE